MVSLSYGGIFSSALKEMDCPVETSGSMEICTLSVNSFVKGDRPGPVHIICA